GRNPWPAAPGPGPPPPAPGRLTTPPRPPANNPPEPDEPLADRRVLSIEAAGERLAIEDLVVDRLVDEGVHRDGPRRRAVLLGPGLPETREVCSAEHDAGPWRDARIAPQTDAEHRPADDEEMEQRRSEQTTHSRPSRYKGAVAQHPEAGVGRPVRPSGERHSDDVVDAIRVREIRRYRGEAQLAGTPPEHDAEVGDGADPPAQH